MNREIYADANATYPVDPSHYDELVETLKRCDGNPSSIHAHGRNAKVAIEQARRACAQAVGCTPEEWVFTSGATESNNLVIQGYGNACQRDDSSSPIIATPATEHPSVLEPAQRMAAQKNCELILLPVDRLGKIDPQQCVASLQGRNGLLSIMIANNETGVIHDVLELAETCKEAAGQCHIHIDAVQALGKMKLDWIGSSVVDSASFSGHKIGALKGCGGLYLKRGTTLQALAAGGGQERSRRPGTENVPGIISMGMMVQQVPKMIEGWSEVAKLRDLWLEKLAAIPNSKIHGEPTAGLANTVNFHIEGVGGDDILMNFDLSGIRASSGSACSSGLGRASHVLTAMGYNEWEALNSIRTSFTQRTTADDIDALAGSLQEVVKRVRPSAL